MKENPEIGVHSPQVKQYCDDLQHVLLTWSELSPSEIIAGLDMVKLQFQLEIFDVLDSDPDT